MSLEKQIINESIAKNAIPNAAIESENILTNICNQRHLPVNLCIFTGIYCPKPKLVKNEIKPIHKKLMCTNGLSVKNPNRSGASSPIYLATHARENPTSVTTITYDISKRTFPTSQPTICEVITILYSLIYIIFFLIFMHF